jgi:hypothetical protein
MLRLSQDPLSQKEEGLDEYDENGADTVYNNNDDCLDTEDLPDHTKGQ